MMMNVSIPVLQRLQYVVPTASRHGGEGVNDAAGFGSGNQCLSFVVVVVVVLSFLHFFFCVLRLLLGCSETYLHKVGSVSVGHLRSRDTLTKYLSM